MLDTLTAIVEAGAAASWVLPVVLLVAVLDALVPVVPSEGIVVALAAVAVAGDGPDLLLLAVAAGAGAFVGDSLTYLVGRRFGPRRLERVGRPGLRRAVERASATLERRGAVVILAARYVPLGRVAVNLTAGATGFPPRRFVAIAALAATTWAAWSVGVGALAGHWLEGNPLLGSATGVVAALLLGLVVDRLARRFSGWGRMPSPAPAVGGPGRDAAVTASPATPLGATP
ncbi:hypothetical protein GCM10023168_02520 [Fodinibacter luteus]|uniref:VTT domain-containing protein n=1 Tax=Fodinibacter luteus TaxID=552064 RepID=A0ABP8JXF1_9MICO